MKKVFGAIFLFMAFSIKPIFAIENATVKSFGDSKKMTYQAFENGKLSSTLIIEKIDDNTASVAVSYETLKPRGATLKLMQKDGKTGETYAMKLVRDDKNPQGFWQVMLFFCLHGSVSYNNNSGWSGTFEYDCRKFTTFYIAGIN